MVVDQVQLAVSAAIGIAIAPAHGTEVSTLLQHADIAMYNAKDKGDGGIEIYDADHNLHSTRRLALAGELQAAIADGLLEVFYQPKADLVTGSLHRRRGARALGAPAARPDPARRVRAARRGHRPDARDDRARARTRARAVAQLARRRASTCRSR